MNTVIADPDKTPVHAIRARSPVGAKTLAVSDETDKLFRTLMIDSGCMILMTDTGWIARRTDIEVPYARP